MATKLDKTIKREVEVDGKTYTLTIGPAGLVLTAKRARNGVELTWKTIAAQPNLRRDVSTAGG